MMKIVAIIVLIGVVSGNPVTTAAPDNLTVIDNPAKTDIEKIPYHVSIRLGSSHSCSGAIISKDWILTAGQCGLRGIRIFSVHAGSSYTDIGGSIHNISRMIIHENFTLDSSLLASNDVALIQITPPLTFDATRRSIELYENGEKTEVGKAAVISGYGSVRQSRPEHDVLLIQNVTIISRNECKETYSYLAPEDPGQICSVYFADDKDFCQVDRGGPLTVNGRLAGIVSRGEGCPGNGRPLVYSDVAYFRDWIKKNSGI